MTSSTIGVSDWYSTPTFGWMMGWACVVHFDSSKRALISSSGPLFFFFVIAISLRENGSELAVGLK